MSTHPSSVSKLPKMEADSYEEVCACSYNFTPVRGFVRSIYTLLLNNTSLAATTPQISAGRGYTMALKTDGTVWAWGTNGSGELGGGTTVESFTPVEHFLEGYL